MIENETELQTSQHEADGKSVVQTFELSKTFGSFQALKKCSIRIDRGEVFGLLGPNGAGKTTLIRLIMGFMKPTAGRSEVLGNDCYSERVKVHRNVAYLPGDARLPRAMTGRGILKFFSGIRSDASMQRALEIADRLELDLSRWVAFMSTGMRQKLALAIVLSIDCPLLILDEPTANLDPTVRGEILELVLEAKRAGRTVVFSSHVLSEIEDICDRVGIVRAGEMVHMQSILHLKHQHRIRGRLRGPLPELPDQLKSDIFIEQEGSEVLIETPGDLSELLRWLSESPFEDLKVEPVGLRAVYDRFHSKKLNSSSLISADGENAGVPS